MKPTSPIATAPAPANSTIGDKSKYGPNTYGLNPSPSGAPVANKVANPPAGVTVAPPHKMLDDAIVKNNSGFASDYVNKILGYLKNDGYNVSARQVKKILKIATFSDDKEEVLEHIGPYIVDLSAENLVSEILSGLSFSDDKKCAVHCLTKYIRKKPLTPMDKETIIEAFSFSSDQDEIRDWFSETS